MDERFRHYLAEGEQAGSRYALTFPRNAPTGLAGVQLGRSAGASLEFKDHREYEIGDDLRRIDWSAYARSDKLVVKLYREEVNPHLDLLVDGSRSMALPDTAKAQATLGLAGALVTAAANTGYSHLAWVAGHGCEPVAGGGQRPSAWNDIRFDENSNPSDALAHLPPVWRNRSMRVLISDLLWLADPMSTLDHLLQNASAVFVVQVLARADVEPPEHGNLRLVDYETGDLKEVFVDASAAKRYKSNLSEHMENWNNAARQVGAVMVTLVAEDVVKEWNLGELVAARMMTVS